MDPPKDSSDRSFLQNILRLKITTFVVDEVKEPPKNDLMKELQFLYEEYEASRSQVASEAEMETESPPTAKPEATPESLAAEKATESPPTSKPEATPESLANAFGALRRAPPPPGAKLVASHATWELPRYLDERAGEIQATLKAVAAAQRELTPREALRLESLVSLGTKRVVLRTEVSVDGDVVNWVAKQAADDSSAARTLRAVHAESVRHAIAFWEALGGFVLRGLGAILDRLLPSRGPR